MGEKSKKIIGKFLRGIMKILYIANSLKKTSGWDRYGIELARAAEAAGHEVIAAVAIVNETCSIKQENILFSPLKYIANPLVSWATARRLNRLIHRFDPDVIHFIVEPYVQILPFLNSFNARKVLSTYGSYGVLPSVAPRGVGRVISSITYKAALKRLDAVVGMGEYAASRFLETYPSMVSKYSIIKAGLNHLPKVNPEEIDRFKRRYSIEQGYPVLLTVGAIKQRKGQLDTLMSLKLLKQSFPNSKYLIIGSDKDEKYIESIRSYSRDNDLVDNLLILSSVGSDFDLACAYAACDVFLLNSNNVGPYFEGFGLVILEANSYGKPVIGSSECGIEDAIRDGVNGLLVGQRDHAEIASAIRKVLNTIDAEACIRFSQGFNWKLTFDSYVSIYDKKN